MAAAGATGGAAAGGTGIGATGGGAIGAGATGGGWTGCGPAGGALTAAAWDRERRAPSADASRDGSPLPSWLDAAAARLPAERAARFGGVSPPPTSPIDRTDGVVAREVASAARRAARRPDGAGCVPVTRSASAPIRVSQARSQERTAATACRTVSATIGTIVRVTPVRRGVSAIATRSAVMASVMVTVSATPDAASCAATASASAPSRLRAPVPLAVSMPGSGRASSTARQTGSAGSG